MTTRTQLNLRLSATELARFRRVADHMGVDVSTMIRKFVEVYDQRLDEGTPPPPNGRSASKG